jgi:uncharacterized protein YjbJ (UPF0337 family)
MTSFKRKYKNTAEKFSGKVKETVGKITDNEQLELEGKLQSSKAEIKENMNLGDKVEEIKESIAGKINDKLDEKHDKKKK